MNVEKVAWSFSKLKCFEQCPRKYQHLYELKDVKDVGNQYTEAGQRDHASLEARVKLGVPLPAHLAHLEPTCAALAGASGELLSECKWALSFGLSAVGWFDPQVWVRMILDAVVVRGAHALVLDYKTGKRDPDPTQLQLFALGVMCHYPEVQTVTTGYVWTRDGALDKATYTRADLPQIWTALVDRVRRIAEARGKQLWVKQPSGLCGYCPVKTVGKCDGK